MSIPTISQPSHPVLCHPDYNPCQKESSECQFSFTSFQYVCCEDRNDVKAPECPKSYNTLRTLCGGLREASCPRGYDCLPSRFEPNVRICCKPNNTLVYPEPDTAFRDNFIVPEHLPNSPLTSANLTFRGLTLEVGQLLSGLETENVLDEPPTISGFNGDDSKL
uniref:Uncharacterized protein n=1 Tax=Acrobeloides nanus TaxID=290746 RepID=A0A914DIQ9_9BILA